MDSFMRESQRLSPPTLRKHMIIHFPYATLFPIVLNTVLVLFLKDQKVMRRQLLMSNRMFHSRL